MNRSTSSLARSGSDTRRRRLPGWLHWIALLLLCAAYLQGGLAKLFDFSGAVAEMQHFGMEPAMPMAAATIVLELAASSMVLLSVFRWLGALALARTALFVNR